jgi:hypothetical protein
MERTELPATPRPHDSRTPPSPTTTRPPSSGRRALRGLALVGLALTAALAAPERPAAQGGVRIDAIGLVDYAAPPDFRIGSWAKYHVTGRNLSGPSDDYYLTVMIGGEQEFWGERCFWVETHNEAPGKGDAVGATLMSYDAFKDPEGVRKLQYYVRKSVTARDENGQPVEEIIRIPKGKLAAPKEPPHGVDYDSLGADTVTVPAGHFAVNVFRWREGISAQRDAGDSTIEELERISRTVYMTHQIPITHHVKEVIEHRDSRKAWLIGQSSQTAGEKITALANGEAVLMGYGEGMEAVAVPERYRKSIAEQEAARAAPAAAAPKPRPPAKKGP